MYRALVTTSFASLALLACTGTTGGEDNLHLKNNDSTTQPTSGQATETAVAAVPTSRGGDGTRLKRLYSVAADGAEEDRRGFWDSQRGETCVFTDVNDSVHICRPTL